MSYRRIAVIMAGGSGERFWPVSRRLNPKQLLRLASPDKSLLQEALDRVKGIVEPKDRFVATAPHLVEPIHNAIDLTEQQILAEPHKRNTAGCLVWVSANILAADTDARKNVSLAILTADHRISPDDGFAKTVDTALDVAERTGGLVVIGIPPTRPETGFGYVQSKGENISTSAPTHTVAQFHEKPDLATAIDFCRDPRFRWNSGMFFWTLDGFLTELESADPTLYAAIFQIVDLIRSGNTAEAAAAFEMLPNVSIDYALMEKAKQVYVVEAQFEWDDVGAWDAIERSFATNESGNVVQGEATVVEGMGNIIVNETSSIRICLLGLEGIAVVATDDAILICPKDRAQDVRKIVDSLKESNPELL